LGHEGEAMLAFEGTAEAGAGLEALAAVVVVASLGALDAVAYHKGQALVEAAAQQDEHSGCRTLALAGVVAAFVAHS
jgi:hypothetical protein